MAVVGKPSEGQSPPALLHKNPAHARVTLVDWMLGNRCNYTCPYCPEALHDGSLGWQRTAHVLEFLGQIADHYKKGLGREAWVQFTGGEPTLNPDLPRILETARGLGIQVSIISNGSRTIRYWKAIAPYLDSIILTLHVSEANVLHFRTVASLLSSMLPVQVNVTMPPDRFEEAYRCAQEVWNDNQSISVILKTMLLGFGTRPYDYTDEQKARIKEGFPSKAATGAVTPRSGMTWQFADGSIRDAHTSRMLLENTNRWPGFRCMAGVEALRITGDGRVFRSVCGVEGPMGRIFERIALPLVGVTCDRDVCSCVSDIHITKRLRT